MIFYSVSINEIHMFKRYKMALTEMHCVQPPKLKSNIVNMPASDGVLDLSEAVTGYPLYQNRVITMKFGSGRLKNEWPSLYSEIQKEFHGKKVKVIFDDDRGYYYSGRAAVSSYNRKGMVGTLVITVDADPYKYELYNGIEPWRWDPFSFVDGIIRNYSDIPIRGNGSITVVGRQKHAVPEIICSTPMTLKCEGKTFQLLAGHTKLYELLLAEGEHVMSFTGNGTVSVMYRGGIL